MLATMARAHDPKRRIAVAVAVAIVAVLAVLALRALPDAPTKEPASSAPSPSAEIATPPAPATPSARARPIASAPPSAIASSRAELVVRAPWGSAVGAFGRKRAHESNPEAPMAIAARGGDVVVLDQVNGRLQRLHDGKVVGVVSGVRESAQDLALSRDATLVLDRLGGHDVALFDASGRSLGALPLVGKGIDEGGGVTGLFADDDGVYVEREHGLVVRIGGLDGSADADRPTSLGRPSRDGKTLLRAAMTDRAAGTLAVQTFTRAGAPIWTTAIEEAGPILYLLMLDSDRRGRVYVAADVGEGLDGGESVVVTRLDVDGAITGTLVLPPISGPSETFRPLSVDDEGAVYEMLPGDDGLVITRTTFP